MGNLANAQEFTGRDSDEAARDYRKAIALATPQLKTTPEDPFLVLAAGKVLRQPARFNSLVAASAQIVVIRAQ